MVNCVPCDHKFIWNRAIASGCADGPLNVWHRMQPTQEWTVPRPTLFNFTKTDQDNLLFAYALATTIVNVMRATSIIFQRKSEQINETHFRRKINTIFKTNFVVSTSLPNCFAEKRYNDLKTRCLLSQSTATAKLICQRSKTKFEKQFFSLVNFNISPIFSFHQR